MQLTGRDEAMVVWLESVRLADMESVRWALGGLGGGERPVGLRVAQTWVSRMVSTGLVGRARPAFRDGSVVWATFQATGKNAPSVYRQTVRHDVAIAATSARFLCAGFKWSLDPKIGQSNQHVADGQVTRDGRVELIEVELTPKVEKRYNDIRQKFEWRLLREGVSRVYYFGTDEALSAVRRHLVDKYVDPNVRAMFELVPAFDARGKWISDWEPVPREGASVHS